MDGAPGRFLPHSTSLRVRNDKRATAGPSTRRSQSRERLRSVKPSEERVVPFISDSTIRFEMSIFGAIMNYAVKKRYVPASQRFDERPKLKTMRRDDR
jgi:hypothetical protein